MTTTRTQPAPAEAAALYREHARALRAWLRGRLSDPALVDDVLQDTFVSALRAGLPEGPPGPWLFGIARNKTLKLLRDRKPVVAATPQAAPASDPAEASERGETQAKVRAAVAALPEELREVIALRYEGGLAYQEIAARLDLPHSTIQGRLKRARLALREALREEVQA